MIEKFSLGTFLKKYKNDEACLEHLKNTLYPDGIYCEKCKSITKFYKVEGRPVYQCSCGYQISPLAGTIFEKTTTPLQYWFFAIFVMAQTRSGVSAKYLQRTLGVTYKTAWRMMKQIRILMAQTGIPLDGTIEVDEMFMGRKGKNRRYVWHGNEKPKQIVMGMVQRDGKAYVQHIPDTGTMTLINQIKANVSPGARILTDEFPGYKQLPKHGYKHEFVTHQATYVVGDVHTQNIDNLWSTIKRGVYGVYRVVSKKYLQAYIDEYTWRYSNRHAPDAMFNLLLQRVAEVEIIS